jgi:hypothetical protein
VTSTCPSARLHDDVWCRTCAHTHIPTIPTVTYKCADCGFGCWDADFAATSHAVPYPDHVVHAVHHQTVPLADRDAPLLTTRDLLANALHDQACTANLAHTDWTTCPADGPCGEDADALLASGAVINAATLANDSDLIDRLYRSCGTEAGLPEVLRALAAALPEGSS